MWLALWGNKGEKNRQAAFGFSNSRAYILLTRTELGTVFIPIIHSQRIKEPSGRGAKKVAKRCDREVEGGA
jgi:hypothetical protein